MSEPISAGGGAAGNPWDRRSERGFVASLIETVKLFVTSPGQGYAQTLPKGDFAGPLIFAVVVGWIGAAIGQLWSLMFGASMLGFLPSELEGDFGALFAMSGASALVGLLMAPIFIAIALFIWSAILHLCVMVVGGLGESQAGFEGTFRTVSFASVAQLAAVVPFFGGIIQFVWAIILTVIGLATLHRMSQGKALVAVLIPLVLCCVCVGIAFSVGIAAMLPHFEP